MSDKKTMTRRKLLTDASHVAAASICGAGVGVSSFASSAINEPRSLRKSTSRKRPNVLFILSDQERNFTHLPKDIDLPAHEFLLNSGVGFQKYYVNTSPCSPSRSVIYTGQHTMQTGMTANLHAPPFPELSNEIKTLGHYLQDQGYYTAYKGKWHLSTVTDAPDLMYGAYPSQSKALESFGFNDFNLTGDVHGSVWSGRKMDNIIASEACEWLSGRNPKDDQPWCLAVNFVNPHDIMFYSTGAEQEKSRIEQTFMAPLRGKPSHPLYRKDWSHVGLPASFHDDLTNKPWAHQSYRDLLSDIYGHISPDNETAWLDQQSYYFNCLRDVSRQANQVIQQLIDIGELDNTIIIYTSDHGEMAGAHGLRQKGPTVYKENSNVPLIIRHPDISQPRIHNQIGSAVDLVPSILEMIGMDNKSIHERYPQLKGVSLAGSLLGNETARDKSGLLFAYGVMLYSDPELTRNIIASKKPLTAINLFLTNLENGSLMTNLSNRALHRGIFDGRYKFARYFAADSHHVPLSLEQLKKHNDLELYDTWHDPNEMQNLAQGEQVDWSLIASLNDQTNRLIEKEIGSDFGSEMLGPEFLYRL